MASAMPYRWGPSQTPSVIRYLLVITAAVSLISALINPLFLVFDLMGPQQLLALSWPGVYKGFIWQLFTYMFVHEAPSGLFLITFLGICFNLYILWILGTDIQDQIGTKRFLLLYFGAGISAALIAVLLMPVFGQYSVIYGPAAALLGLFTFWAMLYPNSQLMLFFAVPMRTKWLFLSIAGLVVFLSLTNFDFVRCAFYLTGILFGYFFGLLACHMHSPFEFTRNFDNWVIGLLKKVFKRKDGTSSKVYDFKSGKPVLNDDAFIDAMLTKIAKYGEKSLSMNERYRMEQISKKKRQK